MSQASTLRYEWNTVNWRKLEIKVFKLQKQIYQASQKGNIQLVRKLQRLLLSSSSAKMLAVRKVTQDNRGKKTAGVDGKTVLTNKEREHLAETMKLQDKVKPIRRIWIDKPGKKEKRPLGIPTIEDRAKQAQVKLALEPQWEARFEPNSYGFRPGRSCHDAMEAIREAIKRKQAYVLDADIAGCFDNIDHQALLLKLNTYPRLRKTIKAWLKAGVLQNGCIQSNDKGTPQGGIISPLLANIALHGMETDIKHALRQELFDHMKGKKSKASYMLSARKLSVIRYADDFVVIHENKEIVLKAKIFLKEWLKSMGLELKEEKTNVCHTYADNEQQKAGFEFLGFNIRQYKGNTNKQGYVTLIKPGKENVKKHLLNIKEILRNHRGETQDTVIRNLNPIIKGWSRYYQHVVSRKVFERADHETFQKLWRWARYRHPHKGRRWVKDKYFLGHNNDRWRFKTKDHKLLVRHSDHKINRFVKVRGTKSPYDDDMTYWASRVGKYPGISPRLAMMLKKQKGKCFHCNLYFKADDIAEVHHSDGNKKNNRAGNLLVLHGHCHDDVHKESMYKKHQITEEPDVLKGTSPVLKPSMGGDAHT